MDDDLTTAESQMNFNVSSSTSQADRDAIAKFLSGNSSLEGFLSSLGFESKLFRGDARKIGPQALRRDAEMLRSYGSHKFPTSIKERLLELNCGQLLAIFPESSGVADSELVAELLFDEFADDPIELGEQIYRFTQYRKKPYEVFEKVATLYREKYPQDPKRKNEATADFFATYFTEARMAQKPIATIMICSIDHESIVSLSDTLLTTVKSPYNEKARFLDTLDAETFDLIAELTILEDFERFSAGIIVPHSPYEEAWDLWLSQRLENLIDSQQPTSPTQSNQPPTFTWNQFQKTREAFDPLSFPRTSAVLAHIGMQHYPTHIQDRVLSALESLDTNPEYAPIAKIFVEAILDDAQLLYSEGGTLLLEAIENNFTSKFPQSGSKVLANQSLIYEIKLAAAIASANGIELKPTTERLLTSDEPSCVRYIQGGSPSETFLDEVARSGNVETVIALMEQIQSPMPNITLSKEQLETIEGRFLGLVSETIQTGSSNAPGEVAAISFNQAARLNELHPFLESALKHAASPSMDNVIGPIQNREFG